MMAPLLIRSREVAMPAQRRDAFEPVDKPVKFYESMLLYTAEVLWLAAVFTHSRVAEIAAAASLALLIAVSLWKLLMPPRLSVTRCVSVFVGLYGGGVLGAVVHFAR
jgi:hypothetical protein